jgi:hypothetical protein
VLADGGAAHGGRKKRDLAFVALRLYPACARASPRRDENGLDAWRAGSQATPARRLVSRRGAMRRMDGGESWPAKVSKYPSGHRTADGRLSNRYQEVFGKPLHGFADSSGAVASGAEFY